MDTKWSEKTLTQKVRYVCGCVLLIISLIMLTLSIAEIWKHGFYFGMAFLAASNMLQYWDYMKARVKHGKVFFIISSILLIVESIVLLDILFR